MGPTSSKYSTFEITQTELGSMKHLAFQRKKWIPKRGLLTPESSKKSLQMYNEHEAAQPLSLMCQETQLVSKGAKELDKFRQSVVGGGGCVGGEAALDILKYISVAPRWTLISANTLTSAMSFQKYPGGPHWQDIREIGQEAAGLIDPVPG